MTMSKTSARALYLALLQDAHQRGELMEALPPRAAQQPVPDALVGAVFPRLHTPRSMEC